MKKIIFLSAFLLCFSIIMIAQDFSRQFGKITAEEIKMTVYPHDKDAEAVVLFDKGESYFERVSNRYDVVFERTTRIKILSAAGLKWAEVEIPFYQEGGIFEAVTDIKAVTYNYENGRLNRTEFNISQVYDEKINNYWNVRKFVLPNVKEGSIIEYRYKITSQYLFNLRDWNFQWQIPVEYSEYKVKMIPFYEYIFLLQGATKFDHTETYAATGIVRQFRNMHFYDNIHVYAMKRLPAFRDETFISSINDYLIKINFQLAKINYPTGGTSNIRTTWRQLIYDQLRHTEFGRFIKRSQRSASRVFDDDKLVGKTEREKFDILMDYVKNNYNWDNNIGRYASKSVRNFIKDKHGNSADINLFTIGLLRANGIEAYPVIISTRNNGKILYDYPFNHFFNYVLILVNIDGSNILTDATYVNIKNDRIPQRCINDRGLIIDKDRVEWVNLYSEIPSESNTKLNIKVSGQELIVDLNTSYTEYESVNNRSYFGNNKERVKNHFTEKGYNIDEETIVFGNIEDVNKPYMISCEIKLRYQATEDKIYIKPFINEPIDKNPLRVGNRTYPIDMVYPVKRTYTSAIKIPDGYKVDILPDELRINNEYFELDYSVTNDDDYINITFFYYFKKPVYSANIHSRIRFFFGEIIKKRNEKVVFSKSE